MKAIVSAMTGLRVFLRRLSDIIECQIDGILDKMAKLKLVFIPEKVGAAASGEGVSGRVPVWCKGVSGRGSVEKGQREVVSGQMIKISDQLMEAIDRKLGFIQCTGQWIGDQKPVFCGERVYIGQSILQ